MVPGKRKMGSCREKGRLGENHLNKKKRYDSFREHKQTQMYITYEQINHDSSSMIIISWSNTWGQ